MKQLLSITFLLALLVSGCSQEEIVKKEQASLNLPKVTATFEQNESRTYIENGKHLRWNENDQISFFYKSTLNLQYQFDGETGDNAGTFSLVNQVVGTGNDLESNYAVYPYASNINITEGGVITAMLPSEQSYAENSFGLGDNTMVAVTEDTDDTFLKFKNVGGYLMLQLYGEGVTVKSITLTGNNNEKLAGKATISSTYGSEPSVNMTDEATETITLDCGEGVELGTSAETATTFWFVVPPTAFENGFTITIEDINGGDFTKTTSKPIEIERNAVQPMSAFKVEPQVQVDDTPYLTFSTDAAQSLTMSRAIETLEYSVNGNEWKELGTNTVDFGGILGDLRLRGKSSMGTATKNYIYSQIIFGTNSNVSCLGDIRTLIDYDNYSSVNTTDARFGHLFYNCTCLITAPQLPITQLASSCYVGMFSGCTKLASAPQLPARTLSEECYYEMFLGCKSLISAPNLPAENLANSCYSRMFWSCTSLTSAPELLATTLKPFCYASMFYNCISLVNVSDLAATTLANGCCMSMFKECTNLIKAPKLSATKLVDSCYSDMFSGCIKLNNITMLATDVTSQNCLSAWVLSVSSTGTFTKSNVMHSLPDGTSGIPNGWTVKNYGE